MSDPFPSVEAPIAVPLADTLVVTAALDQAAGRAAVEHVVRDGLLRPFDIVRADVPEPLPLWVPYWRVAIEEDGAFGTTASTIMVCARAGFPAIAKLVVTEADLTGPADMGVLEENGARVVDADVPRLRAESLAVMGALRGPLSAVSMAREPRVLGSTFVLYPVYYARYGYEGEARRRAGEEMFVAVSGKTGEVLASTHPSAARAVTAKVRRLLSFDRRL